MSLEEYNLNWHTYADHLREMLHEMMISSEFTDVTLVCDDKRQFKAHKNVLSASSPVFKSILQELPQDRPAIYLRGINHQEMESILEFIYSGGVTFNQERLKEFLNVAKNLEIKGISNEEPESYDENVTNHQKPEILNDDTDDSKETSATQSTSHLASNQEIMGDSQLQVNYEETFLCETKNEGMFVCDHCQSQFTRKDSLRTHIKLLHEGMKYPCNQCDYQAPQKHNLIIHVKSRHEGLECDQCQKKFSHKEGLRKHNKAIHEGIKYACNQCDYQATQKSNLKTHITRKH